MPVRKGGGIIRMSKGLMGVQVNFMVTQLNCSDPPPPPAMKNDRSPKGLLLLQFFDSDVTFEEYKDNFFGDKCLTSDTNFALISYR